MLLDRQERSDKMMEDKEDGLGEVIRVEKIDIIPVYYVKLPYMSNLHIIRHMYIYMLEFTMYTLHLQS